MKIDLHIHSTVSDGTDSPEEILQKARDAGIGLFALTDHDAVMGSRVIRDLLGEGGPRFLSGAEFSCKDEEGKYHILGYGCDLDSGPVNRLVETGHGCRMEKVRARLDFIRREFGFAFSEEDEASLLALNNPGKPHIALLMVKYGYAESKEEGMLRYLNQLHFSGLYLKPEEAVGGILASGGVPVLAHPVFGSGDQYIRGAELEKRVRRLTEWGLGGLEGFYSGFSEELRAEVLSLADRYGLYVTAGSDYHGRNKTITLGDTGPGTEPLFSAGLLPDGLRRFLADVCGIEEL